MCPASLRTLGLCTVNTIVLVQSQFIFFVPINVSLASTALGADRGFYTQKTRHVARAFIWSNKSHVARGWHMPQIAHSSARCKAQNAYCMPMGCITCSSPESTRHLISQN